MIKESTRRRASYCQQFRAGVRGRLFKGLSGPVIYSGIAGLMLASTYFLIEQILRPPCCDALHYKQLADAFYTNGMDNTPEALRTFAYPWLLAIIRKFSSILNIPFNFSLLIVQLSVYYSAVIFISKYLCETDRKLGATVYLLLCFNIFLIPYFGITLTDAIYTSLTVWSLLLMMRLGQIESDEVAKHDVSYSTVFCAVFVVCVAIAMRPAAIWLIGPLALSLLICLRRGGARGVPKLATVSAAATSPLLIQVILNAAHFGKVSFFPTTNLGQAQIIWGIENIKYATWLGGGSPQNFYSSASIVDLSQDHSSALWYLNNPLEACSLIIFKTVGAFDFDYLMPYPYASPTLEWLPSILSASIAWFGLCGVVYHLLTERIKCLGSRYLPATFLISWSAVTIPSAVELRFSLPMICFFMVTGSALVHKLWRASKIQLTWISLAWIAFIVFYIYAADFVRSQSALVAG